MLVVALAYHRGPLRASLRSEYGLDLRNHGLTHATDLADLVAGLPQGCALWRSIGGAGAWSNEEAMLTLVEHRLRVLAWQKTEDAKHRRNVPDPIPVPRYAHEEREAEQVQQRRADRYLARQRTTHQD